MIRAIFSKLSNFGRKNHAVRGFVRDIRWQLRRVPLIRDVMIAFDTYYFRNAGTERPSHPEDEAVDPYFQSYAHTIVAQAKGEVLDLGCGYGYLTRMIAESDRVVRVRGVDKIDTFKYPHQKIAYATDDILVIAALPGKYDTIVSSEFVEHIPEEAFHALVGKIAHALKPGGVYLGSTPHNPTPYPAFSGSRFHVREYSVKDLEAVLRSNFSQVTIHPTREHCLVWEARNDVVA